MEYTAEEVQAVVPAAIRLFEHWQVDDRQACAILNIPAKMWRKWKSGIVDDVGNDQATRLSLLLGIHVGLQYLYTDRELGYRWMRAPNFTFDGQTPLEIAATGSTDGLFRLRSYLDAERA